VLATAAGVATARRMAEAPPIHARTSGRRPADRLDAGGPRLEELGREKEGAAVAPNPTDRGKPGSKYHLLVDRRGVLLAAVTAANVHDSRVLAPLLDAVASVRTG